MYKDTRQLLSDAKYYEGYSRYVDDLGRYETWDEAVDRVMNMHREYYKDKMSPDLEKAIEFVTGVYKKQGILGAQRALQFGGDQILSHQLKMYNCLSTYIDRAEVFGEIFYSSLCGCGVGFSVQKHHIAKLPNIVQRTKAPKIHVVEDSIEGWADALDALMASYFEESKKHPEYRGHRIYFDLGKIRPKGSKISGGFKAPGPDPLRLSLDRIEHILQGATLSKKKTTLSSIQIYDIIMHAMDAVISGGVRRSATICLFSVDDTEMMNAKTGSWYVDNPQRGRSNNSAIVKRDVLLPEQFALLFSKIKEFGEPGFVFVDDLETCFNPCFTGDTLVATADGRNAVSIEQLTIENKPFPVYSAAINTHGKWTPQIKNAVAFKTGTRKVVSVKLSNGDVFRCTPEHRLAIGGGDYVKAVDSKGLQLSEFYSTKQKYRTINSETDGHRRQYRMIWEFNNGPLPRGHEIDHIHNNGLDNLGNLQLLSRDDHLQKTSHERKGSNNPIHRVKNVLAWKNNMSVSAFLEGNSNFNGITNEELILNGKMLLKNDQNISFTNLKKLDGRTPAMFSKNRFGGKIQNLVDVCKGLLEYSLAVPLKPSEPEKTTNDYSLFVEEIIDNNETEDVYDLKVEDNNNFYIITSGDETFDVSRGVLVHNCVEIGMYPQLEGESGFQGCVRGETALITRTGITTIEETVGQEIEIWNGVKWAKVVPFITGKDREFYRVSFGDGSYLDATENHKFLVKHRFEKKYRELTTVELINEHNTTNYRLSVPRFTMERDEANKISVKNAYDFGFILGDGTVRPNKKNASAVVFEPYFGCNFPITGKLQSEVKCRYKSNHFSRTYYWNSVDIDLDFAFRLKYSGDLPDELYSWDRKSLLAFFAGWIDTDGTITSAGSARIYGTEQHIRCAQLLLTSLGINSSVNLMAKKGETTNFATRKRDVWFVQITETKDLYSYKGTLVSKPAKMKGQKQTIVGIDKLEDLKETSYCFEEPETHCGVFNNVLTRQCNLTEINGGMCDSAEAFYELCEAGAILGTIQAGYTKFKFLPDISRKIFEREALIGVSITGWMSNPSILFDPKILRKGAGKVKETNKRIAKLLGINPAARTTTVKPSGNASVLLKTPSGIHPEHSPMYLRNVQISKDNEVAELFVKHNPHMVEESGWSATKTDYAISFPVVTKEGSLYKDDIRGVKHLELVKLVQQNWVEYGTDIDLCVNKSVRHNVSNTIVADDWDEIEKYVYKNRQYFAGISFISDKGDKDYYQAPYTRIIGEKELIKTYGPGAIFASGLIVDGNKIFEDLWSAIRTATGKGEKLNEVDHETALKIDWVRRFNKFALNYFDGDMTKAEYCLKDVFLLHKWFKIQHNLTDIDWTSELKAKKYIDIDTMGAASCVGVTDSGEATCFI